jgi:type II secretory pathway component PulM
MSISCLAVAWMVLTVSTSASMSSVVMAEMSSYSIWFRVRRSRPRDRKAVEGGGLVNCAVMVSWIAQWPPRLVARSPYVCRSAARLVRAAS